MNKNLLFFFLNSFEFTIRKKMYANIRLHREYSSRYKAMTVLSFNFNPLFAKQRNKIQIKRETFADSFN